MAADKMSVISFIQHYQRSILKSQEDEERLLHCLEKLHELHVLVTHLQATGVGRTVNALRKRPGPVGEAARKLVARWKQIVEAHVSSEDEGADHVSSTRDVNESPGSDCDTNVNQLSPSPSSEETSRRHPQTEGYSNKYNHTEEESSDEEERKMEMNNHRHLSPPTKKLDKNNQERSSRERSYCESNSHERSSRENKSHEKTNRASSERVESKSRERRENNSHERNIRESTSRERSSSERKSRSRERSGNHESRNNDKKDKNHHREHSHEKNNKNSKNNHEKSKSSHDRHRDNKSESVMKESSKNHHNNKNDDKYNNKYKSSSDNKYNNNIKQEKSGSNNSHNKKNDRHHNNIHIKTEPSDKHVSSNNKNKDKKINIKSESTKYNIKHEPSTSRPSTNNREEEDNYKRKKIKLEPEPLTFDFVRPKIKEEPLSDNSDDETDNFANTLGALDLPVPKFKKENSPAIKKKIKSEPVEEVIKRVKFEENGDESPVGASFEEALGFIDYTSPSKSKVKKDKKKKHVSYPSSSSSSTSTFSSNTDYAKPLPKSEEIAAILDLPAINPNYRPLPQVPVRQQQRNMTLEHDTLSAAISNKTLRTKVYSGNKSLHNEVSSLQDMCIKILQEHIDALDYIGFAPYYLMEPVLCRANASQLTNIERHNPILAEDTDELWEALVHSDFKGVKGAERQNGECWRDVYERSMVERHSKLDSLTKKIIQNNEARKAPQRTTKLAYVNTQVKPPRSVIRQQAKHGTARGSLPAPRPKPVPGEDQPGPSGLSSHASTLARTVGMLRDGPSMSIKSKKRPAPLMQKTLKFMKTSFRR